MSKLQKKINENQINFEDSMIIKKLVNRQIVNFPYCEWSDIFEIYNLTYKLI